MQGFSTVDYIALAFFALAWFAYWAAVELTPAARSGLNPLMDAHRRGWMEQTVVRENRIVDTTILASLQNGTAFFASTSLFAVGGVLALLQSTETALSLFEDLPFGLATSRVAWEVKVIGLAVIFVYAFFKFAWAYRLSNYCAILIGAAPPCSDLSAAGNEVYIERLARIANQMGHHFNRGLRAYFFALAALGWFIHPVLFILACTWVLIVLYRRDFRSREFQLLGGADGGGGR